MSIGTLFQYLIGRRDAIVAVAADRRSLWIGGLFVLSAAFAREYDGHDLLHEPWHLLIPFAASLPLSLILFSFIRLGSNRKAKLPGFWTAYRQFLNLFWMTAPLALLYAIPYERFLSEGAAAEANMWTLGLVAAWRVLLISRAIGIMAGCSASSAFFPVMLVADASILLAIRLMPQPIFQVMGGIRQTGGERALLGAILWTEIIGFPSLLIWLIGTVWVISRESMSWLMPAPIQTKSNSIVYFSTASLLIWALILPTTQREQRLRTSAEQLLRAGRIAEAIDEMSRHSQSEYPPHWNPPPLPGYGEDVPPLLNVVEYLADQRAAEWVRKLFVAKLEDKYLYYYSYQDNERRADWPRVELLLQRLPEGQRLLTEDADQIQTMRRYVDADKAATRPTTKP